jgi:hypothetical protein
MLALLSFLEQSEARGSRQDLAAQQFELQKRVSEQELAAIPQQRAIARASKALDNRHREATTNFQRDLTESSRSSFHQGQRDARELTIQVERMTNNLAGSAEDQRRTRTFLESQFVPRLKKLLDREDIQADEFRFRGAVSDTMEAISKLAVRIEDPTSALSRDRSLQTALQITRDQVRNLEPFSLPQQMVFSSEGPFGQRLNAGFQDLQRQRDVVGSQLDSEFSQFRGKPESFEHRANRLVQDAVRNGFQKPAVEPFTLRTDLLLPPSTEPFREQPVTGESIRDVLEKTVTPVVGEDLARVLSRPQAFGLPLPSLEQPGAPLLNVLGRLFQGDGFDSPTGSWRNSVDSRAAAYATVVSPEHKVGRNAGTGCYSTFASSSSSVGRIRGFGFDF